MKDAVGTVATKEIELIFVLVAIKLVFSVFKRRVETLSVKLLEVKVIVGMFPTKVFELMFVFMAIKEVLLVFILKVEVFIVLFKKVPVVFVDVKFNVEILLVSELELNVLVIPFAVILVEPMFRFVELRLVVVVFMVAVVIVPLKTVEITSKFGEFILAF